MTRKLFVKTYGCQMNVYDSERMVEALGAEGYVQVDAAEGADMVLLNTCHIREKAVQKLYSDLGRLRPLREANPDLKIGVAGCVAQAEGQEIMRRQPMVDLVVGPQTYHRLPKMMEAVDRGEKALDTDFPEEDKFAHLPRLRTPTQGPTAFLTVQEGCDKFCSFCVVPYTRGSEVSRPAERLLAEARALVARGVREITLLGQNVNAYHGAAPAGRDGTCSDGEWGLARLIREMARIDGLDRLRFTTSHPNDMEDDLIAAHGDCPELMPYLHLPVQAGSDKVLKAMNRKHTAQDYIRLIERIRNARPDLHLSGDFIVGFPGETEDDFQATLDLVETVGYGTAYSFRYSARPGTPAAARGAQVPEDEAGDRLQRLQALLTRQQRATQDAMVGRRVQVLFEKPGRVDGQMVGKSEYLHSVHVEGPESLRGQIATVQIVASRTNSLTGRLE